MAYTVLARKYRPQTFSDLVGQEHVTRTLGNAITTGRVAHAFLFTGVRGVGKTTTARILAKALDCVKGPTPEPCGVCDPCREITNGVDLDVLEIDGASNNGVDDVRRLQETIPFRPARDRFKIVIVDEVHMLSAGAFNAFLKTLEEPPPHVKFIFATTEAHKVPITIRSRCQRYDFRLIPQGVVAARVREVLARESIRADDAAIEIVARESAGSMRDALTLLDQIVAFAGDSLVGDEVARVLGIADRDLLHQAAAAVLEGHGAAALEVIDALASRGLDMLHFARALTELVRDLVVLRTAGADTELVSLAPEERRRAVDLAQRTGELELQRAFASLSLLLDEIAKASMPRLVLEMGLVRMATRPPLRAIAEIVGRLEALERGGSGAAPRGGGGRGTAGGGRPPARAGGEDAGAIIDQLRGGRRGEETRGGDAGGAETPARAEPARTETFAPPLAAESAAPEGDPSAHRVAPTRNVPVGAASVGGVAAGAGVVGAGGVAAGAGVMGAGGVAADAAVAGAAVAGAASGGAVAGAASGGAVAGAAVAGAGVGGAVGAGAASPGAAGAASVPAAAARFEGGALGAVSSAFLSTVGVRTPAPAPRDSRTDQADVSARWEGLVLVLMETQPMLGAILQHATPIRVAKDEIVLAFDRGSLYAKQADGGDSKSAIAGVAEKALGARPRISIIERAEGHDGGPTIAELEARRHKARFEAARKKALNHPMVLEALAVFGARADRTEVRLDGD